VLSSNMCSILAPRSDTGRTGTPSSSRGRRRDGGIAPHAARAAARLALALSRAA